MSAQTWKDEFNPVEAIQAVGSWQEAADHSLRRWRGTTYENLEKHGITGVPIILDYSTCALCRKSESPDGHSTNCDACVIPMVNNGIPCTDVEYDEDADEEAPSPYDLARWDDAPEQLIAILILAVEYAKERGI